MFSRIRNHEKLVENGENPITVAKKTKDGTHERNSELPGKINKNSTHKNVKIDSKLAIKDEKVVIDDAKTVITDDVDGGDLTVQGKKKKMKKGDQTIEINEITDFYKDVALNKNVKKGKKNSHKDELIEEQEEVKEYYEGEEYDDLLADLNDDMPVFDTMPTEEEMAAERNKTLAVPYEQSEHMEENETENENENENEKSEELVEIEEIDEIDSSLISGSKYIPKTRQTLLFSATALRAEIATKKSAKDKKWLDKVKIKGIGSGAVKSQGDTQVSDVTGTGAKALVGVKNDESINNKNDKKISKGTNEGVKDKEKKEDVKDKKVKKNVPKELNEDGEEVW
eukprot:CAMPEP_0119053036 /NCGR_PEP_ID=MMETSP1177-20130426/74145_1 /TAXON_ID=2985 /ORGANISM="Ochromonas sp, Strain CCMP1899" /LENGTH=339 /DNA_ID=CAMNT_0007032831 /DNA_START=646 /DNA_END=1662 /DNA_ORIENTATION=+